MDELNTYVINIASESPTLLVDNGCDFGNNNHESNGIVVQQRKSYSGNDSLFGDAFVNTINQIFQPTVHESRVPVVLRNNNIFLSFQLVAFIRSYIVAMYRAIPKHMWDKLLDFNI